MKEAEGPINTASTNLIYKTNYKAQLGKSCQIFNNIESLNKLTQ
jgi:hypothetical protein